MNTDAATKAWLTDELTSALGFAEVGDIVAYVLSSFGSKQEVAGYLTELLGISSARAESISERLFAPAASAPQARQGGAKAGKAKGRGAGGGVGGGGGGRGANSNSSGGSAGARGGSRGGSSAGAFAPTSAGAAAGLVPPAAMPNSRLKAAKPRKSGAPKMMNSHVINCLVCGKIEHNGGRVCTFCGAELHYEELDELELDHAARAHTETLARYDETSAERTAVADTEQFYEGEEETAVAADGRSSHAGVTLDLDLESRQSALSGRGGGGGERIWLNEELTKDVRALIESAQRRLEKASAKASKASKGASGGSRKSSTPAPGQRVASATVAATACAAAEERSAVDEAAPASPLGVDDSVDVDVADELLYV